jgi:hypothetical protein
MDHTTLQVENWARTKQTQKPFQIKPRHFLNVSIIESNYEGIPLNSNWLTMAGFTYQSSPYSEYNVKGIWELGTFSIIEFENSTFAYNIDSGTSNFVMLEYVHKLQNLYCLIIGKKLIIETGE